MATTPEGKVKAAVKKVLTARNVWFFMPMQNGFGVVGIPDFICCAHGRFIAIETKAPGRRNDTTANQDRRLQEIKEHGGLTLVVDDVNLLIDFLEANCI
jgi:hypothetical protein